MKQVLFRIGDFNFMVAHLCILFIMIFLLLMVCTKVRNMAIIIAVVAAILGCAIWTGLTSETQMLAAIDKVELFLQNIRASLGL